MADKFIKDKILDMIDELMEYAVARRNYEKQVIYWLKDWWAEGCPYGIDGIIKKIKKI